MLHEIELGSIKAAAVLALINLFVDICLLRKGPQDVPASTALFVLALVAAFVAGVLLVAAPDKAMGRIALESLTDLALLMGFLWIGLKLRSLDSRFLQTATAALGTVALISLAALPLVAAVNSEAGQGDDAVGGLAGLFLLALVIWNLVVFGHILRHSLNLALNPAMALAVVYTVFAYSLLGTLFGGA